jgi:hypothetical protein
MTVTAATARIVTMAISAISVMERPGKPPPAAPPPALPSLPPPPPLEPPLAMPAKNPNSQSDLHVRSRALV